MVIKIIIVCSKLFLHSSSASSGQCCEYFGLAAWANSITSKKLSVSLYVCVLTRVAQIITATCRDLWSCMDEHADRLWLQTKKLGQSDLLSWVSRSSYVNICPASWAWQLQLIGCSLIYCGEEHTVAVILQAGRITDGLVVFLFLQNSV